MNYDPHGRLAGVHPKLAACVALAATLCTQPFVVVQGLRTEAEQEALYAQGRTAPGKIVTWVRRSNHQAAPDGWGHAVDLAVVEGDGSIDWNHTAPYDTIKAAMTAAAERVGLVLRWGADWNMNNVPREHGETDEDHFEIHTILEPTP